MVHNSLSLVCGLLGVLCEFLFCFVLILSFVCFVLHVFYYLVFVSLFVCLMCSFLSGMFLMRITLLIQFAFPEESYQ